MTPPDAARIDPARRCIWLSDEDMATPLDSAFREIVRAKRDAAPADPVGATEVAIFAYDHGQIRRAWTPQEREEYSARADCVLRALGWEGPA